MLTSKTYLIGMLVLITSLGLSAQHSLSSERARFKAQIEQDTFALQYLLAEELVYIHSNTLTESKVDFIESVGSGSIRYLEMTPLPGQRIRELGRRVQLIDGTVAVKGLYRGQEFDIKLRYSSVYHKKRNLWQLVNWQSTKVE